MGRPREFDTDVVVDCALDLFWREGYDGAGVADLEHATGVGRKGLYNTFGGKQGLFHEALNRYVERAVKLIVAPLEAEKRWACRHREKPCGCSLPQRGN